MENVEKIDFDTMRVNCIQIYQEVADMHRVAEKIGIKVNVLEAEELKTDEKTKTWDGMRSYAKELYENDNLWKNFPRFCVIKTIIGNTKEWDREKSRNELLDCYYRLQGK